MKAAPHAVPAGDDVNLALKDIRHNLGRFLLTCLGLSLLLGIVLAMVGIYRGLIVESLGLVRAAGGQVWVVEGGTRGPFAEASRLPGDTRIAIASQWGVAAAGGISYQNVEAQHRGRTKRLLVVGAQIARPGEARSVVEGRPIMRSRYEAVADRGAGLALGEQIRLGRDTFTVVGLTSNLVASGGDPVLFITLRDAQKLQFDLTPAAARRESVRSSGTAGTTDTVNAVLVRLLPGVDAKSFAQNIARWKHLAALTQEDQETVLARSVIDRARRQIGLFTTLLLIVSTVIIGLIIYTMTIDKKKAIATLKLIGAPDRRIVGLIVEQALAMGIISFAGRRCFDKCRSGLFPASGGSGACGRGDVVRGGACRLPDCKCTGRAHGAQDRSCFSTRGVTMAEPAVVEVRRISKHFGEGAARVDALRDVSLSVFPGTVIGLRGPSGSGKSTLLNVIGCILEPNSGVMRLNGELVYDGRWLRADLRGLRLEKIGFIFQPHNLLPFLNAWENIAVARILAGAGPAQAKDRALELLTYLGIERRQDAMPGELSGGEAQRVAIARALANDPRIILADEPTAALDSPRAGAVMDLLRKVAAERRAAVIVVTHDEKIFDRFDHIYSLRDGALEAPIARGI